MLIRTFVLKVINNEYAIYVYYICIYIYKNLKKEILLKKLKNHSTPLKLQQNIKICHKFI